VGGHIVLVAQKSQTHEPLIQSLAAEATCALCFRFVEEAVAYLLEPRCPAAVVVFNVTMRRRSDYTAVMELGAARPELQILLVVPEPSPMLDLLSNANRAVSILDKPLNHPESREIVQRALKSAASAAGDSVAEADSAHNGTFLLYTKDFLMRVGMADVPVLLSGETGVGKEVMARKLRDYSLRADKPFLKLNCAALPPELAENELFGSVKGAFTGANADRQGRFETAHGGTILLDEIGDMDLRLQTKLLQVLQDGEIQPLGSNRTIKVNVRIMAATHRDMTRAIQDGTFREDLYYRLNVIRIVIPPLRDRREEILPLAQTLLFRHLPKGHKAPVINDELKRFLLDYRWPGNVRELENVMRRFIVYRDSAMLIRELLNGAEDSEPGVYFSNPASLNGSPAAVSSGMDKVILDEPGAERKQQSNVESLERLAEASRNAETKLLLNALQANRWNRRRAAASLEIEYKAFLYKLQKYGIVESKINRREITA
jgi:DNA-binding NtrC family response regulator